MENYMLKKKTTGLHMVFAVAAGKDNMETVVKATDEAAAKGLRAGCPIHQGTR